MNQIFGQKFIIFGKLRYMGQLLLKLWAVEVIEYYFSLLQFIEYRLDQLNNQHTKIAAKSAIQCFEGCSQNKYLLKV